MLNVLLTIHMVACIALVIAVMLQRSEGGALGMSGGGTGGVISGRGAAGMLVKATMVLAGIFFITSITMTRLNNDSANQGSILERQAEEVGNPLDTVGTPPVVPAPTTTVPDPLGVTPAAPTSTPGATPAAPAAVAPAPAQSSAPDPLAPTTPAPAPATTAPTTPAPTPENGGSPN